MKISLTKLILIILGFILVFACIIGIVVFYNIKKQENKNEKENIIVENNTKEPNIAEEKVQSIVDFNFDFLKKESKGKNS